MPDWIRLVRRFPLTKETAKSMEGKTYCWFVLIADALSDHEREALSLLDCVLSLLVHVKLSSSLNVQLIIHNFLEPTT